MAREHELTYKNQTRSIMQSQDKDLLSYIRQYHQKSSYRKLSMLFLSFQRCSTFFVAISLSYRGLIPNEYDGQNPPSWVAMYSACNSGELLGTVVLKSSQEFQKRAPASNVYLKSLLQCRENAFHCVERKWHECQTGSRPLDGTQFTILSDVARLLKKA
ncbi:hypothetical protein K445DRAFT_172104 [Daldinia sp. EC12]|nr:hypothetical protein K445DRAFT_172104 [Daldinia sp. EC12]